MAFAPKQGNTNNAPRDPEMSRDFPTPKAGNRAARIALIVDLGIQEREDFVDQKTQVATPQAPKQQVAIFADLVADVVDYKGDIGKAPYRLMLNKNFKGDIQGINFAPVPPRDADGKLIEGKLWTYHPASPLTKLAKVTATDSIIDGSDLDIEQLLGKAFMATVEVKITETDKEDREGNKIVYKNVNYKGCSEVPEMPDGSLYPVPNTPNEPMVITFDDVTAEQVKFLRADIKRKIKLATNYPGSKMQEVLEAAGETASETPQESKPATKPTGKGKTEKAPAAEKPKENFDNFDDDIPF